MAVSYTHLEKLYIDFHYCPYVAEWIKQGRNPEEMATLCEIAMEGDRAIGETFDAFKFTLGKTCLLYTSRCV